MLYIKKEEAKDYVGDGYCGIDYLVQDKDIDLAIIKINGRSPENGYQVNTNCKELLYIVNGSGVLYLGANDEIVNFCKGDVILLDKNEKYAFDGLFEAVVSCTPAWTMEQHKYITTSE